MPATPGHTESPRPPRHFATTRWTLVRAAGAGSTGGDGASAGAAADALGRLCELYWYPLYAFVRRKGYDADAAADLTQGFFADFIARQSVAAADPGQGRFRSYLLASLQHFIANERERAAALKRGGGRTIVSFDAGDADQRYRLEPAHDLTPERLFDRQWAIALIHRALDAVRQDVAARGKLPVFERLKSFLTAPDNLDPYRAAAADLGMSEGAVKVAVHRMRQQFREALRAAIAETVAGDEDVDDEVRHLFASLAR
jgi:RNA polymerase sigma-70 factor (ECF subfamily)